MNVDGLLFYQQQSNRQIDRMMIGSQLAVFGVRCLGSLFLIFNTMVRS